MIRYLAANLGVTEHELLAAIPLSLVAVLVGFVACVVGFIRFWRDGMMTEIVVITPPTAETDIEQDLVKLTEYLWRLHHPGEGYGYGLGGEFGYGTDYANDVFEMHQFYWGDCTCGYEERAGTWSNEHPHTATCFSTRYDAEYERRRASGVKEYGNPEADRFWEAWAAANGYDKGPPSGAPGMSGRAIVAFVLWNVFVASVVYGCFWVIYHVSVVVR